MQGMHEELPGDTIKLDKVLATIDQEKCILRGIDVCLMIAIVALCFGVCGATRERKRFTRGSCG